MRGANIGPGVLLFTGLAVAGVYSAVSGWWLLAGSIGVVAVILLAVRIGRAFAAASASIDRGLALVAVPRTQQAPVMARRHLSRVH